MGPHTNNASRQAGFTLIEVVVVMLIFTVVIAMAAVITRGVSAAQKRSITATRMAGVDAALLLFVQQQKRLPCPADGSIDSTVATGVEMGGGAVACTGNQQKGVVPWRTLGITETDATDGWDRRLTYRVAPELAATGGIDLSWCDPAGAAGLAAGGTCVTACTGVACTPPSLYLAGKGLQVRDNTGVTVLMDPSPVAPAPHTGAAYVMLSAGESGGGAYLRSGILGTSAVGDGLQETQNYANAPYPPSPPFPYYVDNSLIETAGGSHFDDVVSRPSVMSVASKAGLGPRAHSP